LLCDFAGKRARILENKAERAFLLPENLLAQCLLKSNYLWMTTKAWRVQMSDTNEFRELEFIRVRE
jgi:hypothetical protein